MAPDNRIAQTRKTSPINCDGMQLTNAQCRMVMISIFYYRVSYMILEYTIKTKQERIIILHYPKPHRHGHTISWYVYVSWEELISVT